MRLSRQVIAGILGENGDAAFLFLVVGVHHAFGQYRAFAERAGLLEQTIDQGGLAMVDVGDNGDIAEFFDGHGDRPAQAGRVEGQADNCVP